MVKTGIRAYVFNLLSGLIGFQGALLAGFTGVLLGDTLLYTLGRLFGRRAFQLPGLRRLFTPERIDLAQKQIRAHRKIICFIARFLPGLRAPVYLTVGVMHVSFWSFFILDGIAAMISVPIWVYVGHFFGQNLDVAWKKLHELQMIILPLVAVVVLLVILKIVRSHRKEKQSASLRAPDVADLK